MLETKIDAISDNIRELEKQIEKSRKERREAILAKYYVQIVCESCGGIGGKYILPDVIKGDYGKYTRCDECGGHGYLWARCFEQHAKPHTYMEYHLNKETTTQKGHKSKEQSNETNKG